MRRAIPDALALSHFTALLAPVVIVAVSAVTVALVGILVGLVAEWRDAAARRTMRRTGETRATRRPVRDAA